MVLGPLLLLASCEPLRPCDFDDQCSSDEMCLDRVCQSTTGRTWRVEVSSAEVGADHPDGAPWDPSGGPPDLYVEFGLPSDGFCVTSVAPQTNDPVWFETCDIYVPHDPTFFADLWDADGTSPTNDDLGASYTWDGDGEFTELARTAGHDAGWIDASGTVVLWLRMWPGDEAWFHGHSGRMSR
jgi:hypothetical protein